jgi:hypothetical protein
MVELVATILIIVSSALLFVYWFRYTCLLILSAKTSREYGSKFARENGLDFLEVQSQLREGTSADFERLHAALDRDYSLISNLLKRSGDVGIEKRMLDIDYRLIGTWYRMTRGFSPTAARRALEEMSLVVAHFANAMGEQAACASAA